MVSANGLIPSKRFDVWRRLYDRYALEPFPASDSLSTMVAKTIVPVTQADVLLQTEEVRLDVVEVQSDTVSVVTVPKGERWQWHWFHATRSGGDRNIDRILIRSPAASMILESFTAVSTFNFNPPHALVMEEDWEIRVRGIGGATDGDWTFSTLVTVENLF